MTDISTSLKQTMNDRKCSGTNAFLLLCKEDSNNVRLLQSKSTKEIGRRLCY